jgi:GH25 family lysozyme M1 (1,4-beta-N-acetylmuramidase)
LLGDIPAEGIDVSSENGPIEWARVTLVEFVYLRGLIGLDTRDERVVENANGCRATSLPFGVYGLVYARHLRPQDAAEQGRQLVALHRETGATLLPALDCEDGPPGPPNGWEWLAAIEDYVEAVASELGRAPLVYLSPAFVSERAPGLSMSTIVSPCPLWLAAYEPTCPEAPLPWRFMKGQQPTMWQYESTGSVAGIRGNVDRSRILTPGGVNAIRC